MNRKREMSCREEEEGRRSCRIYTGWGVEDLNRNVLLFRKMVQAKFSRLARASIAAERPRPEEMLRLPITLSRGGARGRGG